MNIEVSAATVRQLLAEQFPSWSGPPVRRLDVPGTVHTIVRIGDELTARYPLPWSVQTWLPGVPAGVDDPGGSVAFAEDLAELIGDLRAIDVGGRALSGTYRGGDLHDHDAWMETCFAESERLLAEPAVSP